MQNRWYQDAAEFAIYDYFEKGQTGNPVVAMPTGTGKSVVIAKFIRKAFEQWPNQRIMMLTHVAELIEQNAERLLQVWPTAPIGVYSAGLNSRETIMPIIFGGVQSVEKEIERSIASNDPRPEYMRHFGWRDLILIDECHLLSDKDTSRYQKVIAVLKSINPKLKIIGFTATPYRMRMGKITENGIFTDVCFDVTGMESFNRLIAEGWLSPLVPRPTNIEIAVENVKIINGEFNSKQLETEAEKIVDQAVRETLEIAHDRQSAMVFASGIDNAEHINAVLQSYGISSTCVHSKLSKAQNNERIKAFKAGEFQFIVNNNKLTTGFDHPPIDLIVMLRPTLSTGLWVQMLGRGTRPSPATGKQNCMVLDFARNTPRLGPINDPVLPKKPGKGGRDAPIKICKMCGVYNHSSARRCDFCGAEFHFETKIFAEAGTQELIKGDAPIVEYLNVDSVIYNLHEKRDKNGILISPPSIKVSYYCGFLQFSEWVCLEHPGYPGKRARDWWRNRHKEEPPPTTYQALQKISELRKPSRIKVHVNAKHPEILGHEW